MYMYLFRYLLNFHGMFRWLLTLYLYIYDITYLILSKSPFHQKIMQIVLHVYYWQVHVSLNLRPWGTVQFVYHKEYMLIYSCKFCTFLSRYEKISMYITHFINSDMHVKIFCSWLRLVWSLVYLVAVRSSWMTRYI